MLLSMFLPPLAMSSMGAFKDFVVKGSIVEYMKQTTIINTVAMLQIMKVIILLFPLILIPGALKLLGVELSAVISNPLQYKKLLLSLAVVTGVEIAIAYPFFYGATSSGLYVLSFMGTVVYLTITTLLSVFVLGEKINKIMLIGLIVCFSGIFTVIYGASKK